MASEPCQVCGCTELKLIDGFYYCVECDTQNTNVRETVIDHKSLGDGTFALSTRRKVKIQDTKIESKLFTLILIFGLFKRLYNVVFIAQQHARIYLLTLIYSKSYLN